MKPNSKQQLTTPSASVQDKGGWKTGPLAWDDAQICTCLSGERLEGSHKQLHSPLEREGDVGEEESVPSTLSLLSIALPPASPQPHPRHTVVGGWGEWKEEALPLLINPSRKGV
jgi:hypothetical protein